MTLIKELSTVGATRSLFVHLGVLFFVIFPVGILVLIVVKLLLSVLFSFFQVSEAVDGIFWLFSPDVENRVLWRMETCTLMNCTAAFVALVVFMIRALLKMGELPSSTDGITTLHVRLGFRMVALPLLTVLVCMMTSLAVYFIFTGVEDFVDTYFTLSMIVLLPTAIGTWIWVWRGAWITSIQPSTAVAQDSESIDKASQSQDSK